MPSLKVLCVAGDRSALAELKRAAVSAEWELGPGATTEDDAIRQLHLERPHVLIVFGSFPTLVERALEAYPSLRVITDRAIRGRWRSARSSRSARPSSRRTVPAARSASSAGTGGVAAPARARKQDLEPRRASHRDRDRLRSIPVPIGALRHGCDRRSPRPVS